MTRKDFVVIARDFSKGFKRNSILFDLGVLTIEEKVERDLAIFNLLNQMTNTFSLIHPRFDSRKFKAAATKGII